VGWRSPADLASVLIATTTSGSQFRLVISYGSLTSFEHMGALIELTWEFT
jgi:hypothetical protein